MSWSDVGNFLLGQVGFHSNGEGGYSYELPAITNFKKVFSKGTPDNATVRDTFENLFTGNLDYQRSVGLSERAEATSAREAQKAREFSASEAEKARQHSSNEARILREWQQMMSDTAYSRAIADLRKNGINPYAIGSFNAASTPSGGQGSSYMSSSYSGSGYTASAPQSGRLLKSIENVANSAFRTLLFSGYLL